MLKDFVSTGIIHDTVLTNVEAQKETEVKIDSRQRYLHLIKINRFI